MALPDLEQRIIHLERVANAKGVTVYALLNRNAGWGVELFERARCPGAPLDGSGGDAWKKGLVVYEYHGTLREAVETEVRRLEAIP